MATPGRSHHERQRNSGVVAASCVEAQAHCGRGRRSSRRRHGAGHQSRKYRIAAGCPHRRVFARGLRTIRVPQGAGRHRSARRRRRRRWRQPSPATEPTAEKEYGVPAGVGPVISVKFTGVVGEGKSGIYDVAVAGLPPDVACPGADRAGDQRHRASRRDRQDHVRPVQEPDRVPGRRLGAEQRDEEAGAGGHRHQAHLTGKTIAVVGAFKLVNPEELAGHAGEARRPMTTARRATRVRELATPCFRARNVAKSYGGIHALKGVNFDIHRGKVTTLFGENGAGKSTLMKILSGVVDADIGRDRARRQAGQLSPRPPTPAIAASRSSTRSSASRRTSSVRDNIFMGREIADRDRRRLRRGGAPDPRADGRSSRRTSTR